MKLHNSGASTTLTRRWRRWHSRHTASFTFLSSVAPMTRKAPSRQESENSTFWCRMVPCAQREARPGATSGLTTVTSAPQARSISTLRSATSPPPPPTRLLLTTSRKTGQKRVRRPVGVFSTGDKPLVAFIEKFLQLIHEFVDVLEGPVHRREPHVGDLIQVVKFLHDPFADHLAGDLALPPFDHHLLDLPHHFLLVGDTDGTLLAGLLNAAQDLL